MVDDGSSDNTLEAAAAAGAEVKRICPNKGKGNALNQGAPLIKGDIVVLLDADLGSTASEAEKLVDPIRKQKDITVAKIKSSKESGFWPC